MKSIHPTWLSEICNGVFIIAEAGINHNGNMDIAKRLVDVAVHSGADAIKFQTFRTESLLTKDAPKAEYQRKNTGSGESQFEMLKAVELSEEQHLEILKYCQKRKVVFISTPFDEHSADLLEQMDVPLFKVPSGEITNLPFLEHIARKGRPMIISTGMSFLEEVKAAVRSSKSAGCSDIALLHCVSNYPTEIEDVNLKAMRTMEEDFRLPVGFSDHTTGNEAALAAVALGAQIIEKHFTLDKNLPGPDHKASLAPGDLTCFVESIRNVEAALGDGVKRPVASELSTRKMARKSLVFRSAFPAGTVLTEEHTTAKRPNNGLSPGCLVNVLGRRLLCNVDVDQPVSLDILE